MTLEIFVQLFYWHGDLPSSWIRGFSRFPIANLLIFLGAIYEDLGQIDRPEFSRSGKVKAAICELNQAYFFPLRNYRSQDCQKIKIMALRELLQVTIAEFHLVGNVSEEKIPLGASHTKGKRLSLCLDRTEIIFKVAFHKEEIVSEPAAGPRAKGHTLTSAPGKEIVKASFPASPRPVGSGEAAVVGRLHKLYASNIVVCLFLYGRRLGQGTSINQLL
jgi:hypothetical protein